MQSRFSTRHLIYDRMSWVYAKRRSASRSASLHSTHWIARTTTFVCREWLLVSRNWFPYYIHTSYSWIDDFALSMIYRSGRHIQSQRSMEWHAAALWQFYNAVKWILSGEGVANRQGCQFLSQFNVASWNGLRDNAIMCIIFKYFSSTATVNYIPIWRFFGEMILWVGTGSFYALLE